mmetsp:Transcript_23262/g.38270  ORF Transcript_23262/g.38270 Transcript_23262/m.38270 type:complete len:271 (-) Transcript_23262:443-1255(-)
MVEARVDEEANWPPLDLPCSTTSPTRLMPLSLGMRLQRRSNSLAPTPCHRRKTARFAALRTSDDASAASAANAGSTRSMSLSDPARGPNRSIKHSKHFATMERTEAFLWVEKLRRVAVTLFSVTDSVMVRRARSASSAMKPEESPTFLIRTVTSVSVSGSIWRRKEDSISLTQMMALREICDLRLSTQCRTPMVTLCSWVETVPSEWNRANLRMQLMAWCCCNQSGLRRFSTANLKSRSGVSDGCRSSLAMSSTGLLTPSLKHDLTAGGW